MEEAQIVLDRQSFEALAADTRVKILKLLVQRRKTLSELSKELKMSVSGVKEHLETLEKAGLVEKIDDGHKWKYYELTDKGAAIVAPKPSMRIMLLLSLSIVAFMASAFVMFAPPMADALPMAAEVPEAEMQKTDDALAGGMEEGEYSELPYGSPVEDIDGVSRGEIEAPLAASDTNTIQSSALWDEEPALEHAMEAQEGPEVPLPLIIALLSLGTMLVCFYELSKKR